MSTLVEPEIDDPVPDDGRKLMFLFQLIENVKIPRGVLTVDQFKEQCSRCLKRRQARPSWQAVIVNTIADGLSSPQLRVELEGRFQAIQLHAGIHPDRDALLTNLAQRAMLGEFAPSVSEFSLANFTQKMERIYTGNVSPAEVWSEEWGRFAERWKLPADLGVERLVKPIAPRSPEQEDAP